MVLVETNKLILIRTTALEFTEHIRNITTTDIREGDW